MKQVAERRNALLELVALGTPPLVAAGSGRAAGIMPDGRQAEQTFRQAMRKRRHPGMVRIVTDNPLHPDRRSGRDFVIMSSWRGSPDGPLPDCEV